MASPTPTLKTLYLFGYLDVMPAPFASPVKRSITIAGHATSISLEPVFWEALEQAAQREKLPLSALVARIDAERIAASDPPNLASAIRVWLFTCAQARGSSDDHLEPL
mgnify:CR=1 FL=1